MKAILIMSVLAGLGVAFVGFVFVGIATSSYRDGNSILQSGIMFSVLYLSGVVAVFGVLILDKLAKILDKLPDNPNKHD